MKNSIPPVNKGVEDGFVTFSGNTELGKPSNSQDCRPSKDSTFQADCRAFESRRPLSFPKIYKSSKGNEVTKKVTELTGYFTTDEVAKIEGVPRKTINEWCNKGWIPAEKAFKGSRQVWRIPIDYKEKQSKGSLDWDTFYSQWIQHQKTGYLTGKPIGKRGIQANEYGLNKFFEYSQMPKRISSITPSSLRDAMSAIPIDYEARKCHYTIRDQMHKAIVSVYKWLIIHGLRSREELIDIRELRPKRIFEAKKKVMHEEELRRFLLFNEQHDGGRTPYDKALTEMIILLTAFAGLRSQEVVRLNIEDIDFNHELLHVIDGKNHQNDTVFLMPILEQGIKEWLGRWRPKGHGPRLLLTRNNQPITGSTVYQRISRLAEAGGFDISPHGLRRSFASLLDAHGASLAMVKAALRHKKITTTDGYIFTDKKKLKEFIRTPK